MLHLIEVSDVIYIYICLKREKYVKHWKKLEDCVTATQKLSIIFGIIFVEITCNVIKEPFPRRCRRQLM